jgi:hypothetical protein
MSSATCKPQHFAGDYSIAVYEKGDVRRKECGTGLTSVGQTITIGTQFPWNRAGGLETLNFVRFDSVLNNYIIDFFHIISLHELYKKDFL